MKNRLTKSQLENLIKEQIKENPGLLNEGIWDSIKYGLSKLGSLEVGGKIFRREATRQKAEDMYQELLSKLDDETSKMMKDFENHMEKEYPEFPNMKDKMEFAAAAIEIEGTYEALAKAVENWRKKTDNGKKSLSKSDSSQGKIIDPTTANNLVEALAGYTAKIMDFKLADVYKHFNENKDVTDADYYAALVLEALSKYGEKTATTKGLESRLLPILLGAAGAAGSLAASYATLAVVPQIPKVDDPAVLDQLKNPEYWSREVEQAVSDTAKEFSVDTAGSSFIGSTGRIASNFGPDQGSWYGNLEQAAKGLNKDPAQVAEEIGNTLGRYGTEGFSGAGAGLSGEYARLAAVYEQTGAGKAAEFFTKENPSQKVLEFVEANAKSEGLAQQIINWGAEGSAGVGKGAIGSTIMGIKNGVFTLASAPAMEYVTGALKVVNLGTRGAAIVGGITNPLVPALGLAGLLTAGAVTALRKKGLKSSRAQFLKDIRDKLEKFTEEGGIGEPPPPPIPEEEKTEVVKPILIKFDTEAIKIHSVTMSYSFGYGSDGAKTLNDYMKRMQDQGVVGDPEKGLNEKRPSKAAILQKYAEKEGEISSDDFKGAFGRFTENRVTIAGASQTKADRVFRSLRTLINNYQRSLGRSVAYKITVQPYFVIDGSMKGEPEYRKNKAKIDSAFREIISRKEIFSASDAEDMDSDLRDLLSRYGMYTDKKFKKSALQPEPKKKTDKPTSAKPQAEPQSDKPSLSRSGKRTKSALDTGIDLDDLLRGRGKKTGIKNQRGGRATQKRSAPSGRSPGGSRSLKPVREEEGNKENRND